MISNEQRAHDIAVALVQANAKDLEPLEHITAMSTTWCPC